MVDISESYGRHAEQELFSGQVWVSSQGSVFRAEADSHGKYWPVLVGQGKADRVAGRHSSDRQRRDGRVIVVSNGVYRQIPGTLLWTCIA